MKTCLDLSRSTTRRTFVKTLAAASAGSSLLYGLGCGSGAVLGGPIDVAIVGAGMAGLTAANALVAAGKRVVVLEARARVGGRAFADNTFPVPADLGAQWFHQGLVNPLVPLARTRRVRTIPDTFPRLLYQGSTPVSDSDPDQLAALLQFAAMELAADGAGEQIAQGTLTDQSLGDTMAGAGLAGQPWYDWASNFFASDRGVAMAQLSNLDYFDFTSLTLTPVGSGTGEEFLVPSGMGNFVAGFSAGIPISLSTAVTAIDYSGARVRLTTSEGTVDARTAIVTAPLAVLAAEKISFSPALPESYLGALAGFQPGVLDKVWIQYDSPVFGGIGVNTFISQLADEIGGTVVTANVYGNNLALVLVLGPTAGELESLGVTALTDFAIGAVQTIFPQATPARVIKTMVNPWGLDPWSLGSWAMALPGGVPGRVLLATPINGRLFFAGDGLSLNSASSLAGAYESGQVAAGLALTALASSARLEFGPDDVRAAFERMRLRAVPTNDV